MKRRKWMQTRSGTSPGFGAAPPVNWAIRGAKALPIGVFNKFWGRLTMSINVYVAVLSFHAILEINRLREHGK